VSAHLLILTVLSLSPGW